MTALCPPKPNELLMASRSPSPNDRGDVTTSSGMSGSCSVRLIVGGAVRSARAFTVKTASMAPAPPRRCPVDAFVALTGIPWTASPNTRSRALYSAMSPTGVLVAWTLMCETSEREHPAPSMLWIMARAAAVPSGSGAVMWNASLVTAPPTSSA